MTKVRKTPRAVPIDPHALVEALLLNEGETALDLQSGALNGVAVGNVVDGQVLLPTVPLVSTRRWMLEFVETHTHGRLAEKLMATLKGRGTSRRFSEVLLHFPREREKWVHYQRDRLREFATSWLESQGVAFEWSEPRG